jgi:lipoate-protein ligase B
MEIRDLGLKDYEETHRLQRELVGRVQEDGSKSFLLLVEHPAVYTLGRFAKEENLLVDRGIPVRRIERGGDITYHGPGQLVGYVIFDLYRKRWTLRELVRRIENALIGLAQEQGIAAGRKERCPGVWVQDRKLASLGLALSRRVTYHGFALNVNADLTPFSWIHPCGMPGCRMTSMKQELGRPVDMAAVKSYFFRSVAAEM